MKSIISLLTLSYFVASSAFAQDIPNRYGNISNAEGDFGEVETSITAVKPREGAKFRQVKPVIGEPNLNKGVFRSLGKRKYGQGFGSLRRSTGASTPPDKSVLDRAEKQFDRLVTGQAKPLSKYRGKRTVFGKNERFEIRDGARYPFRTFSLFEITYDGWNNYGHCSATLIGVSTALTAAHCVYDHDNGGWFDQGLIYPGFTNRGAPYGEYQVEDAIVLDGYVKNWSGQYDWNVIPYDLAVIKLSGKPGRRLGTIPIGYFDPAKDFTGNIVGYPGDKPYGTMWRSSCAFNAYYVDATTSEHYCDIAPGSSGSSVYDYEKRGNSRVIVGVNVAESPVANTSVYFDESYFFWICNAVHDFEGRNICR